MDEQISNDGYCLGAGQVGLVVLTSAAATMLILLLISCQTGLCEHGQQVPASGNMGASQPALDYNLAGRIYGRKQTQTRICQSRD